VAIAGRQDRGLSGFEAIPRCSHPIGRAGRVGKIPGAC
jgi:hypothetical protein